MKIRNTNKFSGKITNENIRTYKLKTVTYGLASASFLATRCIKQFALDNKDNPNLSRVLQEDIYMDDLLSGSDTPNNAISISDNTVEVHGFADASSLAYAAAIYCRQKHNGKIKVQLLVSKTKVAPVKQVSIPRLELCGAHLLSKLFNSVLRALKHYTFDVFAWTDSKIVLSWLSSHPHK
ncbi:uncharacterized protein TNCV_3544491 [Trichonephila clavipes]|nr:uncharacterized protein TNCV_3544491 [Trichonephila clavipes]